MKIKQLLERAQCWSIERASRGRSHRTWNLGPVCLWKSGKISPLHCLHPSREVIKLNSPLPDFWTSCSWEVGDFFVTGGYRGSILPPLVLSMLSNKEELTCQNIFWSDTLISRTWKQYMENIYGKGWNQLKKDMMQLWGSDDSRSSWWLENKLNHLVCIPETGRFLRHRRIWGQQSASYFFLLNSSRKKKLKINF